MRRPTTAVKPWSTVMSMLIFALLFVGVLALLLPAGLGDPSGPEILFNASETGPVRPAVAITTQGGTITTMILNGTTLNPHWKGFVGNVTGSLALQDASGYSLYEWALTTVSGEVYVARNESVNWTTIQCANNSNVAGEEANMSFNSSQIDSFNSTFALPAKHPAFSTASTSFLANQCNFTLNTFVNGTRQNSTFYEILLSDRTNLVYTTLLENSSLGFDTGTYDFQLLVAENGSTSSGTLTPYYFYVELV